MGLEEVWKACLYLPEQLGRNERNGMVFMNFNSQDEECLLVLGIKVMVMGTRKGSNPHF